MSIWFILWSLHVVDSLLITKNNIIKSSETSLDLGIHCAELQYLKSCPIASPVQLRSNIPSILQFSFLCFALWRPRTSFTESTWKDLSEYNQTPNVLTTYINIWQTLDLEPDNVLRASTQRKYQTKSSWKQSWVSMFDVAIIFHDIPWSFKRSFTIPNIDRIFLDYCNIALAVSQWQLSHQKTCAFRKLGKVLKKTTACCNSVCWRILHRGFYQFPTWPRLGHPNWIPVEPMLETKQTQNRF